MKTHPVIPAALAFAFLGGTAALAQTPKAGVTPNQASPAPASASSTGVPSVDSSRPTGANAGKTNLPGGEVTSSVAPSERAGAAGVVTPGPVEPVVPGSSAVSAAPSQDAVTIADEAAAPAATTAAEPASATVSTTLTTNGPVPDTPENRAKYGQPLSRAGKMTSARGN